MDEEIEEGEISDSGSDKSEEVYTPLERPERSKLAGTAAENSEIVTRPRSSTNSSTTANPGDDIVDRPLPSASNSFAPNKSANGSAEEGEHSGSDLLSDSDSSSDGDADSDAEAQKLLNPGGSSHGKREKPKRKRQRPFFDDRNGSNAMEDDGGGNVFKEMAAQYQRSRGAQGLPTRSGTKPSVKNNIWGSVLQEESLTAELTGIGVGRTLRDLQSDRGAETYDYIQAHEMAAAERDKRKLDVERRERNSLDDELQDYFENPRKSEEERKSEEKDESPELVEVHEDDENSMDADDRRNSALQAGKKRNVKDRLGLKRHHRRNSDDQRNERRNNPHHSMQNQRPDLDDLSIPPPGIPRTIPELDPSVVEAADVDPNGLGRELAAKLSEPKTELMLGVLDIVGVAVIVELFEQTRKIESDGGMMTKNGARRRTPGGLFLQLLRDAALVDPRVDPGKVKKFFSQSQENGNNSKKKRKKKNRGDTFSAELANFRKFTQHAKKKEKEKVVEQSEDDDSNQMGPDITSSKNPVRKSDSTDLEAPPNSVEAVETTTGRMIADYGGDDDELELHNDAEDIELF